MMNDLTHIDKQNNPTMVDVSGKKITKRTATATTTVIFPEEVKSYFQGNELVTKKVLFTIQPSSQVLWQPKKRMN